MRYLESPLLCKGVGLVHTGHAEGIRLKGVGKELGGEVHGGRAEARVALLGTEGCAESWMFHGFGGDVEALVVRVLSLNDVVNWSGCALGSKAGTGVDGFGSNTLGALLVAAGS